MLKKLPIILISVLLSGCVSIFTAKNEKVTVNSETPDAEIYYKGKSYGKNAAIMKWDKTDRVQEVLLKKDGYLNKTHAVLVQKKSPARFFNILWIPTLYGIYSFGIDAASGKYRLYPKINKIPAMVKAPEKRKDSEKFLYLNQTTIDIVKGDTSLITYNTYKNFVAKKISSTTVYDHKIEYHNTIFSDDLTKLLKRYNFIDTTKTIFPNYANTVYLNSKIDNLKLNYVTGSSSSWGGAMAQAELDIEWEILDYYQVKLKSFKTKAYSDFYAWDGYSAKDNDEDDTTGGSFRRIVENALEHSMLGIMQLNDFKTLLVKGTEAANNKANQMITIKKQPIASASLNKLIKSAVTIKTKNGHGSGFIISEDGYIVTNYHVVANSEKPEVVLNDGTTYNAAIIRKSSDFDLALLKIEKTDLIPFQMNTTKEEAEIGLQVTTIGTPKSVELGQSVSKGIISGIRNANNIGYIQTDVSVNGGNSGGALLDPDGKVIGVVTAKLQGFGVEGIGFAIPSYLIFEKLNIQYK